MKLTIMSLVVLLMSMGIVLVACKKDKTDSSGERTEKYFLSEIRPIFFDNLDFEKPDVLANMASFREDFFHTFMLAEKEYREGKYTSESDIEFFRLESQYFGFYLLAITAANLDGYATFQQIQGNRTEGLFSKLKSNAEDFEYLELQAQIDKARDLMYQASYVGGTYNDKVYGFYLACNQVAERVRNRNNTNDPEACKKVLDFSNIRLVNYSLLPVWNLLMAQVTLTNYADTLNTFDNPNLDILFVNAQARLVPGFLPDLGGKYPEILGPLYRFDLSMKKIDWYLKKSSLTELQLKYINTYLDNMKDAMKYVEEDKGKLLQTWADKNTFYMRKDKWKELRNYFDNLGSLPKPELRSFIDSKAFKKPYQCFSCHRSSGL